MLILLASDGNDHQSKQCATIGARQQRVPRVLRHLVDVQAVTSDAGGRRSARVFFADRSFYRLGAAPVRRSISVFQQLGGQFKTGETRFANVIEATIGVAGVSDLLRTTARTRDSKLKQLH